MGLAWQQGPLAAGSVGHFLTAEPLPDRLLFVEPSARGHGIGSRLIDECVRFARQAGYRKIMLWTQSELQAARRLYMRAGFTLAGKNAHDSFGRKGLVAETWTLAL